MELKKAVVTVALVATGIALIIVSVPADASVVGLPVGLVLDYLGFMLILSSLGYALPGAKSAGLVQK